MNEQPHVEAEENSEDTKNTEGMRELVEYMVKLLVEDPDTAKVHQTEGDQTVVLEVHVPPDDRGQVIGRRGRTVKAIRTIAQAAAGKQGCRAIVEIVE